MPKSPRYERHITRLLDRRHVWKEGEIRGLCKLVSELARAPYENAEAKQQLEVVNNALRAFTKRPITKEQTDKGLDWLYGNLWSHTCKPLNNKISRCFGFREKAIVRSFKRFEFEGIRVEYNKHGYLAGTFPIYRVIGKKGTFSYSPAHWGTPVVYQGGT